jgi:hypothetical protein
MEFLASPASVPVREDCELLLSGHLDLADDPTLKYNWHIHNDCSAALLYRS